MWTGPPTEGNVVRVLESRRIMAQTDSIAENLERVRERIARAAGRAGRRAEEITIVAVSKTFPVEAILAAHAAGLPVVHEAFADRAYRADGSLVPRSEKGAVLQTEEDVRCQLRQLMMGYVTSVEGSSVPIQADSLCLHTDTPHAVSLARMIRHELESAGIRVAAMRNEPV